VSASSPRVAIIGAGASGLLMAGELLKRGLSVTVFEAEGRVGGKCLSVEIDGLHYELGATAGVLPFYDEVFALSRGLGLLDRPVESVLQYSLRTGDPHPTSASRQVRIARQGLKFGWQSRTLQGPSHDERMDQPAWRRRWSDFVVTEGLSDFDDRAAGLLASLGYTFGEVPAGYVGRFFPPTHLYSSARGPFRLWPEGSSRIWERLSERLIAAGLELRLDTPVRSIEGGPPVRLGLEDGASETFHRVILSAPGALPVRGFEPLQALLRWNDYRSYVIRAEGLPGERQVCIHLIKDNLRAEGVGRPVCWVHPHPETDVHVVFAWGSPDLDDETIYQNIRADLQRLSSPGSRGVTELLRAKRWRHFTHVGSEALSDGYFGRLRQAQGQGGVWLGGEIGAIALLSTIFPHARALAAQVAADLEGSPPSG
jgi:hypothetical protein